MKLATPFVLLILILALVVYLDDTPSEADFVFVNRNDVFTLDPQRMSYLQDLRLASALYEGLVRWNNEDFTIRPAAADLPTIAPDGKTYTFQIREGAAWSNGDPVTAHDFIYAWKRAILPDSAADYSNLFFLIDGAQAFFDWRQEQTAGFAADLLDDLASGEPSDSETVRLTVRRIERLLDADRLPKAIALPDDLDKVHLRAGLRQLLRIAERGDSVAPSVLEQAPGVRGLLASLDDAGSRAAEAAWMWAEAESRFAASVGLAAPDDRTLHVHLARSTAYFLDLVAFGVFSPVHRPTVEGWILDEGQIRQSRQTGWHTIEAPPLEQRRWMNLSARSGRLEQQHDWTKPARHVGNGPYRLEEWRYKRDMRLVKSPTYHRSDEVRSGTIVARVISDTNTAVLAFESGRLDWLSDVNAEYQADMLEQRRRYIERYRDAYDRLLGDGLTIDEALAALPEPGPGERRNIHAFPTFGTDFYSFNCRPGLADGRANPFADAAVRRAFAMSVNKQTIVQSVTRLGEPVLNTLIPPGSIPGYESPPGLEYDPDEARRVLAATGWRDRDEDGLIEDEQGELFPIIDLLWTTNTPRYKWISLELKAQWERELGVRIELRGADTKFYKDDLIQGKFMIARGRWYGDYGDPTTFLNLCQSTDGNNDRGYENPLIDSLLEVSELERHPERRMDMLRECERILCQEEVPMVPICQLLQIYMYEPGEVAGLSSHPRLTQYLWQIKVDEP